MAPAANAEGSTAGDETLGVCVCCVFLLKLTTKEQPVLHTIYIAQLDNSQVMYEGMKARIASASGEKAAATKFHCKCLCWHTNKQQLRMSNKVCILASKLL